MFLFVSSNILLLFQLNIHHHCMVYCTSSFDILYCLYTDLNISKLRILHIYYDR